MAPDNEAKSNKQSSRLIRSWRAASPLTKITLSAACTSCAATILYTAVAGFQLFVMYKGSKDTGTQTAQLIAAAQSSATAQAVFAPSATSMNTHFEDAVRKLNSQAEAMRQSEEQTRELVLATRQSTAEAQSERRPWVGIQIGPARFTLQVGERPTADIVSENYGGRPAKVLYLHVGSRRLKEAPPIDYQFGDEGTTRSLPIIMPSQPQSVRLNLSQGPATAAQIENLREGNGGGLYVLARIVYSDAVTGARHTTQTCVVYEPNTRSTDEGLYSCSNFNFAD